MAPERSGEAARRRLVALAFLFYAALLAEGSLRKWIWPGGSNALVFLRDPIALAMLGLAVRRARTAVTRRAWAALAVCSLLLLLCTAFQSLTTTMPALVFLVGFRNYLLFVPVAIAIAEAFRPADYLRWLKVNLWLAGPIAILVVLQYRLPPNHWLNAVPGGENDGVFLLVDDVVRPYGLFSFTLGHSAYAAWMLGCVLAAAMLPRTLVPRRLVLLGAAGVAVMGLFSGSRTFFLFAASEFAVFAATVLLFGAPADRRRCLLALPVATALVGVVCVACPGIVAAMLERQSTAVAAEGSTLSRIVSVGSDFAAELGTAPLFGRGLGGGTNVANFLANGRTDHVLAEYELTRIVQELGPVFGLGYIAMRWSVLLLLAGMTVSAARRGNAQPACFLGFLVPVLLVHDITLQNTMIAISWFAIGILMAACALPIRARASDSAPVVSAVPVGEASCG